MNIQKLAYQRANCIALFEFLNGWDKSEDCDERALYTLAERRLRRADAEFQRACSLYTQAELKQMGIAA